MKKKKNTPDQSSFAKLREDAENALKKMSLPGVASDYQDINALFQELQVYQIELEMQNNELRITNEELLLQQMKFAGIYDLVPIGYFILGINGAVEEVNNAGLSLLNRVKGDIILKRFNTFISPENQHTFYYFFKHMLTSAERQSSQLKVLSTTGRALDAQVEGIAINDFITGQRRCHVAVIDITQRIKTEKNLAGIKERLELALEASATGTWELDLQTMQFNFDEFIYRICDIPFNNFGPNYQSFINYIHEADREMADQHFRTAVNTNMEVDIVCKFNNLYNEVSYINIRGHIAKEPDAKRFIGIMTDITEKRRLEEEASAFEFEQHKKITTATLYAEENERKRVSEALHDSVGQLLYGIKIQLGQLKKHPETSESLDQVNKLLSLAIQETRNISFELAPSILTDFGLPATIEELVRRLSSSQLMLQAKVTGFARRCDPLLELGIFRIVQELINNCMKHSGASLINVEIKRNKSIEILVNDNGKGFDVKRQEKTPTGSGLSSIKNRLGLYEGTLHIKSEAGKGTQVIIKMHPTDN